MHDILTLKRAARWCGLPRRFLRSEAYRGRLRALPVHGKLMLTACELCRYIRIWHGVN